MTKVFTIAHMRDDLVQAWLQHLRDFDIAHPGCHFEVAMKAANASLATMLEALQVEPPLPDQAIFERKKKH